MKKLYAHQQRFKDRNPDCALLVWETGTGKTIAACEWLKDRSEMKALVVCPKGILGKWKRELKEWGAVADVVSRDEIKKIDLRNYGALVLDEAQDFSSPLFDKNRSQRATVIYNYVKSHSRSNILMLTATPVRSTPFNIHTLACYLRVFWDLKDFRSKFFYLTDMFGVMHWEKKKGWQKMIRPNVEQISDIVLLKNCSDVPTQHHQVINIEWTNAQEKLLQSAGYLEPMAEWVMRHRMEQGDPKWKTLKKLIDGYRKVIVVCYYLSQIEDYVARIGEDRLVYVLNGSVKDQDKVIEEAKQADDCVFFLQASMASGFDAAEFSVMIFASMSFKYVDYIQSIGRIKRLNNLHENDYIYLIAGKNDEAVYKTLMAGNDFNPHYYLANIPNV